MMNMDIQCHSVLDTPSNNILKRVGFVLALFFSAILYTAEIDYSAETDPVITKGDSADDPAIWFNSKNPKKSLIFGTDKNSGIYVYDIEGNALSYANLGRINNIDLREKDGVLHIVTSNRTASTLDYWKFPTEDLFEYFQNLPLDSFTEDLDHAHLEAGMDIYGICMGLVGGNLRAILTEEEGKTIQYWDLKAREIIGTIDITAEETNVPLFGNEAEGCVIDDENEHIIISREGMRGILNAYDANTLEFIKVIDSRSGNIGGDPEGVTVYKTTDKEGFIIVSSQGDSKFNLYNRQFPFDYIRSFTVNDVTDTDGIDVTNKSIDGLFPQGFLVVQDGYNSPDNQNFKIVDMDQVLKKKVMNPGSTD